MLADLNDTDDVGTGTKGKRGELIVLGELLIIGLKIYTPLVDSGIDCITDAGSGNYKEIQIKYRENTPTFIARMFKPRPQFYLICWLSEKHSQDYWCIPSSIFFQSSKRINVRGKEYLKLNINSEMKKSLAEYHHTFDSLLTGADEIVRKALRRSGSTRIKEPHLSQKEISPYILSVLSASRSLMSTAEIVKELGSELGHLLTDKDWEKTKPDRPPRWQKNARFAIYQYLKKQKMIEAKSKNQWAITEKGKEFLRESLPKVKNK